MSACLGVLLPYQARVYADRAHLRVVEKSRRIGVTWAEAARQVMLAARRREDGGTDCMYLSTSHRLGRKYIAVCASWARHLGVAATALGEVMIEDAGRDVLVSEIRFASGHKVQALTSNPEALRGEGGDVIIDEGAHHQDLAELLKAAGAVGDWGGNLTVISTHNGRDNPFNVLCEEVRAGKRRGSLHRITLDDALAEGLYRRQCLVPGHEPWSPEGEAAWRADKLNSWGAEEEYLVIPAAGGGVYIRSDLIEECSARDAPVVRLELAADHMHKSQDERDAFIRGWCESVLGPLLAALPRDRLTTIGYDFARSGQGDLSAMALLFERRDLIKECPFLVEMRGVPFEEQWEVLQFTVAGLQRQRSFGGAAIDSAGNGGWLGEKALTKWGPEMVLALQPSAQWYSESLPRFRASFEELAIRIPADVDVRDDLLQFALGPRGVPALGEHRRRDSKDRKPRHGDAAMALLLAHWKHRSAPMFDGFQPAPRFPETREEKRAQLHGDRRTRRSGRNSM